jgi:hypothetical protein
MSGELSLKDERWLGPSSAVIDGHFPADKSGIALELQCAGSPSVHFGEFLDMASSQTSSIVVAGGSEGNGGWKIERYVRAKDKHAGDKSEDVTSTLDIRWRR